MIRLNSKAILCVVLALGIVGCTKKNSRKPVSKVPGQTTFPGSQGTPNLSGPIAPAPIVGAEQSGGNDRLKNEVEKFDPNFSDTVKKNPASSLAGVVAAALQLSFKDNAKISVTNAKFVIVQQQNGKTQELRYELKEELVKGAKAKPLAFVVQPGRDQKDALIKDISIMCLSTCKTVLIKGKQANGSELGLVFEASVHNFSVARLGEIMGAMLGSDEITRVQIGSRLTEFSYLVSEQLNYVREVSRQVADANKARLGIVDSKKDKFQSPSTPTDDYIELRSKLGEAGLLFETVKTTIESAATEIYSLAGFSLNINSEWTMDETQANRTTATVKSAVDSLSKIISLYSNQKPAVTRFIDNNGAVKFDADQLKLKQAQEHLVYATKSLEDFFKTIKATGRV